MAKWHAHVERMAKHMNMVGAHFGGGIGHPKSGTVSALKQVQDLFCQNKAIFCSNVVVEFLITASPMLSFVYR